MAIVADRNKENWKAPFFAIWSGQAFSLIGSKIVQFALIWWLTAQTESATVLATASLVGIIPEILLGPIAGAYVDRWDRRKVMIVADGAIALVSLILAGLFAAGVVEIWHIYVVMFLRALGGSFHWPAMQASTTMMVPEKHLSRVSGLNQAMYGFLNILGAPLGALLIELLRTESILLIDVGTAMMAILPLLFVLIPQPAREGPENESTTIWQDLKNGLNYLRSWKGMLILLGFAMLFKLALTPAFSLFPLFVYKHFSGDSADLSKLQALTGVGIVLGGLIMSAWGGFKRRIITTMSAMNFLGLSLIGLGLLPGTGFGMAAVLSFALGVAIPFVDAPLMAIMQATIAPEKQGRVLSLIGSLLWITSPLGLAISGPMADRFGLSIWYIIAGALCVLTGLSGFFIPALMQIEENGKS
ncbi:MAG: MFS transporter [Anaerolineales bacterium]|nr:MFS transporter [Anaerolineales bacterium]